MKRKQLAAILLSAIMAASACVPVNGISAAAAENAGAESTEESLTVEVPEEAVESVTEAEAPDAQEGTETPDMQGGSAEAAIAPAEEEAVLDAGTPAEETPAEEPAEETAAEAAAAADDTADEATTPEDQSEPIIEEEAREEVSLPALRALQPEDFKNAKEISAGDKKNEKVFRNNGYAVWKFTPDESGSYRFSAKSNCSIYVVLYDADYNEIAYDERPDPCIERYFHKGTTYYLASCPYHPEEIPILSASIRLDRQDMPDFYVEGYSESQIRVPYGKEAVLSVYARSSTGKIYYKWKDGSGKIVGTSDSYTFTAKSNTEIYCTVSDGPDEKTAHSEERRFAVSIENHLTVDADGEYESSYGDWIKSVGFGDPVTLKVTASADDDSELTYRWEREELSMYEDEDGELVSWYKYVTIEGEETDTYEIESADESGMYCCTVTDRFGNMASLYFDLRVANLVSAYPEGAEEGDDTVSISTDYDSALTLRAIVNAADASKVKFVWYNVEEDVDGSVNDWKRIPGADTAEYEIESVEKTERYHCNVSDGVRGFGLNFYVSVENALSVKAEGAEESRSNVAYLYPEPGSSVTLRVIASATDDRQLKYTWSTCGAETDTIEDPDSEYVEYVTIEGANTAEYRVEKAKKTSYKCIVSDQYGNSARAKFFICMDSNLHAYAEGGDERESYLYRTIRPHEDVKLRVIAAAGDLSGITYQWQEWTGDDDFSHESYEDIEGANEDSYSPDIAKNRYYRCVVSNRSGDSADVRFYLHVDNELNAYPEGAEEGSHTADIYPGLGDTVTLKVNAEALDDSCLAYKWQDEDGTQYDADRNVLVIENAAQSRTYTCKVTDQYGNSSEAVFNIMFENHLRAYPEGNEDTDTMDITATPLSCVTLKVVTEADDMSMLTYKWKKYVVPIEIEDLVTDLDEDIEPELIEGADTDTYTIASVDHKAIYRCEVRDRYNNSKTITFDVNVDNQFSAYPEGAEEGQDYVDVYVGYEQSVTLRVIVNAANKDRLTYSWGRYDGTVLENASESEYTVGSEFEYFEHVDYYCFISDGFGNHCTVDFGIGVQNHLRVYPEGYEGHDTATVYAKPGSKVTLGAVVEADDCEDLTTTWYRDGDFESLGDDVSTITVYAEDAEDAEDAEYAEYVFEARDKYGNTEQARFIIKLSDEIPIVDISKAAVTVSDAIYNGKERKPAVRIAYEGRVLKQGTDYTVSYGNNVNAGIKTAKAVVTGDNIALSGKKELAFSVLPGKTSRGDTFNLAGNVKVTWKAVPGAKYYKVYREGVTNASESVSEPVIVTSRLVGWDKAPGLVNGHAYRYRIVASLTDGSGGGDGGAGGGSGSGSSGDLSGDSPLSYSKLMYRLKTVAIKRVKNTEPGKVKVWFDKTTGGDSYVLRYSENADMAGAKTKVVQGAANTSYTIGGLTKGKTYYISIRVRKKVGGVNYYTTFGVAKKITIEK